MTDRSAALTFLTGEVFTGREAERMGLVTRAVAEDDLDLEVDEVCAALAKGNPQGLRETKLLLGRPLVERIDDARRRPGEAVRAGCSAPTRPRPRCWPSSTGRRSSRAHRGRTISALSGAAQHRGHTVGAARRAFP